MCSNLLTLKCYFLTLPPDMVAQRAAYMVHTPDVILPAGDGPVSFCGAEFQILHTPGHSAGHICAITPDNVCYTADAVLSPELLNSKLPYDLSHRMAMDSREKLRGLDCDGYIMAHRGVCGRGELAELIDENQALIRRRAGEILSLIVRPMTLSQICQAVCAYYQLFTHKPRRALQFERNIRFFLDYLTDRGSWSSGAKMAPPTTARRSCNRFSEKFSPSTCNPPENVVYFFVLSGADRPELRDHAPPGAFERNESTC